VPHLGRRSNHFFTKTGEPTERYAVLAVPHLGRRSQHFSAKTAEPTAR